MINRISSFLFAIKAFKYLSKTKATIGPNERNGSFYDNADILALQ